MRAFGFRVPRAVLAFTAVVVASAACGSPKPVKRSTHASNPSPSGFSQATLDFAYEPPAQSVHSGHGGFVSYSLGLRGGSAPIDVELERIFIEELSTKQAEAMRRGPDRIDFARDGHALALARAGETARRYVALDAGPRPLYCRHVTFGTATDPFAGAPTTRDLAIAILRTTRGGAHDAEPGPLSPGHFERELTGATAYACAHRDDPELRNAVAGALVARGSSLSSTRVVDPLVDCAGEIGRADVEPRNILLAAVGAQEPEMQNQVARAARALALGNDPRSAEAIAAALHAPAASRVTANDSMCWTRASLAWSLAKLTDARTSATDAVLGALVDVALSPQPCPDGYGAVAARIYAVRALGVLHSPIAQKTLEDLAKSTCAHPIERWPASYTSWSEAFIDTSHDVGCWAQGALARAAVVRAAGKR